MSVQQRALARTFFASCVPVELRAKVGGENLLATPRKKEAVFPFSGGNVRVQRFRLAKKITAWNFDTSVHATTLLFFFCTRADRFREACFPEGWKGGPSSVCVCLA